MAHKSIFWSVAFVLLLTGVASAVTAGFVEAAVEADLGIGAATTYLDFTNSSTGYTREGLTISQSPSGDNWGFPDSSNTAMMVNANSLDDKFNTASDFQATITGLGASRDYRVYYCVKGRPGDAAIGDIAWGYDSDGAALRAITTISDQVGAVQLAGDNGDYMYAVPLAGAFTSDAAGTLKLWVGDAEDYEDSGNSENARTQLDGLVIVPPPAYAWNAAPADNALSAVVDSDLSWSAGHNAISHDVYFGTSESAVANAQRLAGDENGDGTVDIDDLEELALRWLSSANLEDFAAVAADWGLTAGAEFKGNQPGTTYNPGTLTYNTTYYWRIDEVNGEVTTTGTVWSFTTTLQLLPFTLWQLPAQSDFQMNSYVIQTYNGSIIVIDGGVVDDAPYLKNFLANLGNHVDMWFISHRHHDHIGALTVILQNPGSLQIDTIYGSMPTMSWLQTYDTNAYTQTVAFNTALSAAGKTVTEVSLGQMIYLDGVNIKILGVKNPEFTSGNDNDQSVAMKVWSADKSVMFLGDLYINGGYKLLNTWGPAELNSDYVQMAHHGQLGVDYNVYQAISPTYCLWPTPLWLWNNDNGGGYDSGPWLTLEVRAWMDSLGVQEHYCMFNGLQTIQ